MKTSICAALALALACSAAAFGQVPSPNPAYLVLGPVAQYLMPSAVDEIAAARTAAPPSVSARATILVLTQTGYVTAVKGTNGWVCFVERSWTAGFDDPEFWNYK